jgi:hypothetical protein
MLDIFATRLIKWLIVFAAISTITHAYGLTTGETELVSPIAQSCIVDDVPQWALDTPTILPDFANPNTTPVAMLDGVYVPEESPDGGYPVGWLDNSATYSDGWTLLVNDSTGITSWRAPEGH